MNPRTFEYYETPWAFSRWLFREVDIVGQCYEPCAGDSAIINASIDTPGAENRRWATNDLDPRWPTHTHMDASISGATFQFSDWVVTNPPFSVATEVLVNALSRTRVGVAMYLRASFHEPLMRGPRRSLLSEHPPNDVLWLPRFAYQRSAKTGKWTTDSMTSCWMVWRHGSATQRMLYAPEDVLDGAVRERKTYRARMDAMNGYTAPVEEPDVDGYGADVGA